MNHQTKPLPPTLTAEQAKANGYDPVTLPYRLASEAAMFANALADQRGMGLPICLVEEQACRNVGDYSGPAIWRQVRNPKTSQDRL